MVEKVPVRHAARRSRVVGAAYSVLLLFLSHWVWSGYWAACRAVLPMTVAFNLLLPANSRFWPLWILGNLTLLHGVWRFL